MASKASSGGDAQGAPEKIGVLFVCLGNICRSPSAEATFRSVVEKAGLADKFDIDSCGTGGGSPDWYMEGGFSYHYGDPSDSRMMAAAEKRGVELTSRSRPLKPRDFRRFQYIIGMDPSNVRSIITAANYWRSGGRPSTADVPSDYQERLTLMTEYCTQYKGQQEVPDPYYGGPSGFERVLDLLEDASEGLLGAIRKEHPGL